MANTTIYMPARTWTLLTQTAVEALRVQAKGELTRIPLQATAGSVAPAADASGHAGALYLPAGSVLTADRPLADMWPEVAGADRVWGWSEAGSEVSVSHV